MTNTTLLSERNTRETLWEGKYLRCREITYRDSAGVVRTWETAERVNCDGIVAIVPITDDGDIILIRQFRPTVNNYVIEFPAGLSDRGESLMAAAKRELREETGYEPTEMLFLAAGPLSSGSSCEQLTVYLARGLHFKGVQGRDETEDIEVFKIPLKSVHEEMAKFAKEGNCIDLKIYGFIDLAKKHVGFCEDREERLE